MVTLCPISLREPWLGPDGQAANKMTPLLPPWSLVYRGKEVNLTMVGVRAKGKRTVEHKRSCHGSHPEPETVVRGLRGRVERSVPGRETYFAEVTRLYQSKSERQV